MKSLPKYLPIVAHFAGDSTMTRFLPDLIVGVHLVDISVVGIAFALAFAEVVDFDFTGVFVFVTAMSDHESDKILV